MILCDMYLYVSMGCVAVLELDSHPDHKKGQDCAPCVCQDFLTMQGNDLRLVGAKAFPILILLMSSI